MEENLGTVRLLWGILRIISTGLVLTTSTIILLITPATWWVSVIPFCAVSVVAAILAVAEWRMVWIWLVILVQAFIFTLALFGIVYGLIADEYVPVLLLAFTMILANEHTLTTTLSYSCQFANGGDLFVREFNAESLRISLNYLYKLLARDGLILGAGFVLSVVAVSFVTFAPAASILSDPSLYIVIASISLAALILLKEEEPLSH
ncbi:MAG TPA: hypothetical protein VEI80_01040 [Candidatus Acidoferrales bacterium]|nr:hypothetical protein [Candidatus Acidoferrales bacterium]